MLDELERISAFRAAVSDATDEERSAAREALAQAIAREFGSVPGERSAPPPPRRRGAVRFGRSASPPVRGRLLGLVGLVAAAAVALALWAFAASSTEPSAAAAELEKLAEIAARVPSAPPGPGQYLYVKSTGVSESIGVVQGGASCVEHTPSTDESWIGADGTGEQRSVAGTPMFTSAADRAVCQRLGMARSPVGVPQTTWFAPGCLSGTYTQSGQNLSTDPATLLQQMRRIDGGPLTPAEDFTHVGDFLRGTALPAAVRAALYRAAATIPGVRLLGTVLDHAGRSGIGVAYPQTGGGLDELILDPRTSALIAEQTVDASGTVTDWTVYLRSEIVDSLSGQPPAPLSPPCTNGAGRTSPSNPNVMVGGGPGPSGR
jgi:RNA polymerase sigma-70 factor (ECF subfamily)